MAKPQNPASALPLTPAMFHVMLALAGEERHGYAILKEVEERTGGAVCLGAGTLYGLIKRLLAQGMIEESRQRPPAAEDDERRRYYRLTSFGRKVLTAEAGRLAQAVEMARKLKILKAITIA